MALVVAELFLSILLAPAVVVMAADLACWSLM
jgi:hypothetical protein